MARDDGGPASPVNFGPDGSPGYSDGMSLREYHAGNALVGLLAMASHPQSEGLPPDEAEYIYVAERAYALADAMLSARGGADNG